jgi:hypothetical protein
MGWWLTLAWDGAIAGLTAWLGLCCVWPALRAGGARRALLAVVAVCIAAPAVLSALSAVAPVRAAVWPAVLPILVAWVVGPRLVRLTGGPSQSPNDLTEVTECVRAANELFAVGDIDAWREELRRLDALRTPATERYIDLWQRYASEEAERRAGVRRSSQETLDGLRTAADELTARVFGLRRGVLASLVGVAVAVAVLPPAAVAALLPSASPSACVQAAALLGSTAAGGEQAHDPATLAGLLPADPGAPGPLVDQGTLSLNALAASRHDPNTRQHLLDDQYLTGYARLWYTAEGRSISVEVEQFAAASGASAFDRQAVTYACGYANVAFAVPGGGVGLQVRYGTGDPISEQVSWVVGARRMLVSRTFLAPPATHALVLDLAARTRAQADGPPG